MTRHLPIVTHGGLLLAIAINAACSLDPAERAYLSALRGEETGMSRTEQVALVSSAIALAPDRAWYFETRAVYQIDTQAFGAATADLDRAIALADRPYLHFLRGLARCQARQYEDGLGDLMLAVQQQPENTQFYRGRGLAFATLQRFDEARLDGEHLVRVAPQMAESFYVRGIALQGLARHADAIRDFAAAIAIRPELTYPRLARAQSYDALDDRGSAEADRQAVETMRRERSRCAACEDPFRY